MGIRELARQLKPPAKPFTVKEWMLLHDKKPYKNDWFCLEAGCLVDWVKAVPEKEKQQAHIPARIYTLIVDTKIEHCHGHTNASTAIMKRLEVILRQLGEIE